MAKNIVLRTSFWVGELFQNWRFSDWLHAVKQREMKEKENEGFVFPKFSLGFARDCEYARKKEF